MQVEERFIIETFFVHMIFLFPNVFEVFFTSLQKELFFIKTFVLYARKTSSKNHLHIKMSRNKSKRIQEKTFLEVFKKSVTGIAFPCLVLRTRDIHVHPNIPGTSQD